MSPEEPVASPPEPEQTPPRRRESRWRRYALHALALVTAVAAAVVVSVLTVDLGPELKTWAEKGGSAFLKRPLHIGRLSAKLTPGVFVFEDLVIEGLKPTDRPFLRAKTITVSLPWWTLFRGGPISARHDLIVDWVEMTDWDMVVETWPDGRHNFPNVKPEQRKKGPSRFPITTTVRSVVCSRGQFTYEDHGAPWSTIARNLRVSVGKDEAHGDYRGNASFSNGTIRLMSYEPFTGAMRSRFTIKGSQLHFDSLDLVTDGARSAMDGDIDFTRWPEQTYRITSEIDFPTQKNIFFRNDKFEAMGRGTFTGSFHLFKGGRELKGSFRTPEAGVTLGGNAWRFPNLRGDILWLPSLFEVTNATSGLYGGAARFDYRLVGSRGLPTRAEWDVAYRGVDLQELTNFLRLRGLRLDGRITGRNRLVWNLGKWSERTGDGVVEAAAPDGVAMMTRVFDPERVAAEASHAAPAGPFNASVFLDRLPIQGRIGYRLGREWIDLEPSWTATPRTYVAFEGRTAYGLRSQIPFHVTSLDWQESDVVLAGIMTTFGAPTGAIPIGGMGEFEGVMLGAFGKPRIEGRFTGDRMRAWDIDWGHGDASIVIENSYVTINGGRITKDGSEILADGLFSLGYPRRDAGEEINARVSIKRRPLVDLRHAFELDDWPVEGLVSGNYHLYGKYLTLLGFGRVEIDEGVAYGERFRRATAGLRFEGNGVRVDGMSIGKDAAPPITGAAWIGWDG